MTLRAELSRSRAAPLRLGTRGSALAMAQSALVAGPLGHRAGVDVALVEIVSQGDRTSASLGSIGGTGVFTGALRAALLAGQVDVIVHSLKDLPTAPEPDIVLAAVPEREDPRDVLVARDGLSLGELPAGSRIGTGSPRRAAQLNALALGWEVADIRGNVDTRIGLVHAGDYDAVVLARAGLSRLARLAEVTETLDPLQMLPAPGQGALAVECRADDTELIALLAGLDHPATRASTAAERALLAALEAGCTAPVGALAEVAEGETGPELWLRAIAISPDGALSVKMSSTGSLGDASGLGARLAGDMIAEGAADVMASRVEPVRPPRSASVTPVRRQ
ncbi:MAG: hydroxymethylbilane synthase [Nocardioides sp.]